LAIQVSVAAQTSRATTLNPSRDVQQGSPLTHPKYRPDIDGLRAIAVLSVLGFHAFPRQFRGGFIGVDIFFVISGFLISTIILESLERNSFSAGQFYARRIRRIFPALLIVLIATLVIGWFTLLPADYKQLGKHVAGGAGFASNFVLWDETSYFDKEAETKPLLHLWSLGIEEQFYIVYPSVLWLAWKRRFRLSAVTGVIALLSFALTMTVYRFDDLADFYSPLTRFWELMVGSLLAHMQLYNQRAVGPARLTPDDSPDAAGENDRQETQRSYLRHLRSCLGMLLIAVGLIVISQQDHFARWRALLPTLGAALVISAGVPGCINRFILSNRVLVWFGLISYPLYLWHWILLCFARINTENGSPKIEIRVAALFVSIALSWLTYKLIEKPLRFGKHNNDKAIVLCVFMAVIGGAGFYVYRHNGLPFRFPRIVQDLTDFNYDSKKAYREGTCFLTQYQNYDAFSACETKVDGSKKTLVLWGDSHAAQLYPGYQINFSEKLNIVQRTASGCPPILDLDRTAEGRRSCKSTNASVAGEIARLKPWRVVLAAHWGAYDWRKIEITIVQLKKLGVPNIDVVGPVPEWNQPLPQEMFLYYKATHKIPTRMQLGLDLHFQEVDREMSEFCSHMGVNYISPARFLCNETGCITRFGDTGDSLSASDKSHLTQAASVYLVSNFPSN
jgi:peptidoglycan/LPS O-acetylase OafA/YrhL